MSKTTNNAPYKYDVVGSYLRPEKLKQARVEFEAGRIGKEQLLKVEDVTIIELVEKQRKAGLKVITDGEFRRSWWHLDFMWGLQGVKKVVVEKGYEFHDTVTRPESAALSGKLSGENHPFVEHFKFIKLLEQEGETARQTIPAPAQFLAELQRGDNLLNTRTYYKEEEALISDIAKAYKDVIDDLYKVGCRNIQFDDCTWGMLCDKKYWESRQKGEAEIDKIAKQFVKVNNLALEGQPKDLIITTHVCRGNYHSTWASSGGYDPIAKYLFEQENVSAFYLEYDTERAGGFEPLKYVNGKKQVVLGLITSKTPTIEKKEEVIARIKEASKYISLDKLCLSPQCGFASTEEGNHLTEEEQWSKLKLVKEIAEEVWAY